MSLTPPRQRPALLDSHLHIRKLLTVTDDLVAASGAWGKVVWAVDESGRSQARDFYMELELQDRAKVQALFGRLADLGPTGLQNREKFKFLDDIRGERLFEFKSFQLRFLGAFRPGQRFIVVYALRKKQDNLPPSSLETAAATLKQRDLRAERPRGKK